jgi:multimeric flavodoxin WrbA
MSQRRLLIACHSQSGTGAALSIATEAGAAAVAEVAVCRARCADIGAPEVAASDALLLVCAENAGRLSGGAKDFLDRIFYPLHHRACVLPYALLISAGNDGRNAAADVQRMLKGIPFTPAAEPLIVRGELCEQSRQRAREFGEAMATGLAMGIF